MPKKNRIMTNEFFPPNEEELDQMILEIQQKMEGAESQLEYDQLHDQLKMNRGDLYDFLATTSISQIIAKDSEIDMKYCQFF